MPRYNKLNVFKLTPADEAELVDNTMWYWDIVPNREWNVRLFIVWCWDDVREIYEYHNR